MRPDSVLTLNRHRGRARRTSHGPAEAHTQYWRGKRLSRMPHGYTDRWPFTTDVTFGCSNLPDSTVACVFNTGQADPTKIAAGWAQRR